MQRRSNDNKMEYCLGQQPASKISPEEPQGWEDDRLRHHPVISANHHFASNFWTQKFKLMRHECKLSFYPFLPHPLPPPRESFLAGYCLGNSFELLFASTIQLCQRFQCFSNAVIALDNNTSVIEVNGMIVCHAWLVTLEHFEWHLQVSLMVIPTSLAVSRERGFVFKFYL